MDKKKEGPFNRRRDKNPLNLSIHGPLAAVALGIIALTQLPISLKATLEVVCIAKPETRTSTVMNWCNKL